MILEAETLIEYGYLAMDLPPHSNKPVLAACDDCGKARETSKDNYRALCKPGWRNGRKHTEESKAKISASEKGKIVTEETKALMSAAAKGRIFTEETKAKISAAEKGEKNWNYKGGKKVAVKRGNAKRKRDLGYTLLMPLADDEVGHHVTNEFVIGIPAEVHNSIGGCREKHRTLVLQWLKIHDKKKYKMVLCVLAKQ